MDFQDCQKALSEGKRARRKPWRDSGQYIRSHYHGQNWEELPAADCLVYLIGGSEYTVAWPSMNADLLESDWEIMPEPDYAAFGKDIYNRIKCDEDCEGFLEIDFLRELSEQYALCHLVRYDPKIHGEGVEADVGDKIYYFEDTEL